MTLKLRKAALFRLIRFEVKTAAAFLISDAGTEKGDIYILLVEMKIIF